MSSEGCVLALVWFVLLIVFGVILEGYVIKELWGWFIVPTFSAPILNIRSAIGIALVATALQPTPETKFTRTYSDGINSINVTFGDVQIWSGSDTSRGCSQPVLVGHKIKINYAADTFTASISKTEIKEVAVSGVRSIQPEGQQSPTQKQLHITVKTFAKNQPYSGIIGVRIGVPTIIGEKTLQDEKIAEFSGEDEFTFIFNVTTDGGLKFTPYYKIYASTNNFQKIFGINIFDKIKEPNAPLRADSYERYLVSVGDGTPYLVQVLDKTTNTTVIQQPVNVAAPILTPNIPAQQPQVNPQSTEGFEKGADVIMPIVFIIVIITLIVIYLVWRRR